LGAAAGLSLQGQEFLAKDRNFTRSLDPETNLTSINVYDSDADVFANANLLPELTAEHQHGATLL
jgi:hypothetical protein